MPRDSGGIYSLPVGYLAISGETILPSQHNPPLEDIAAALTASLPRNGAAPMTGNLAMGGNKLTGLAEGTNPNDAVRLGQLDALLGTGPDQVPTNGETGSLIPSADSTRTLGDPTKAFSESHTNKVLTNTFEHRATGDSVPAQYLVHGSAKAWANLNGTGTIALRDSLNVSSVVDNGVGQYQYNLTNAMAGAPSYQKADNDWSIGAVQSSSLTSYQTIHRNSSFVVSDVSLACSSVHGDLA
jgi:hypothetical protein